MHGGSGGMDPAEFLRESELFGAKRERKKDLGIVQMVFDAVITGTTQQFDLGEVFMQLLREPGRHVPQVKAVVDDKQKFHRVNFSDCSSERPSDPSLSSLSVHRRRAFPALSEKYRAESR